MRKALSESMGTDLLLSGVRGALGVTDEWNLLLPHLQLTKVETFLSDIWKDGM